MSGEVTVVMTSDEARLLKSIQAATREFAGMEGGLKGVAAKAREAAKEEAELERAARRVFEQTRTPMENYEARMKQLGSALSTGKIDQDTYGRAAKRAADDLEAAGKKNQEAFGAKALGSVRDFAEAVGGIGVAIGTVVKGLNDMDQVREQAAKAARESEFDVASLSQVATDEAEFNRLVDATNKYYGQGGARSKAEAAQVVFSLQSADFLDQSETLADLASYSVIKDPAGMAKAAATITTAMGAEETGDLRQVISKSFMASRYSPATAESLLEGASRAGASAKALGMKDEELLGATAILSKVTGSADEGGTQLAALLQSLDKRSGTYEESDALKQMRDRLASREQDLASFDESQKLQLEDRRGALEDDLADLRGRKPTSGAESKAIARQIQERERELTALGSGPALKPSEIARREKIERDIAEQRATVEKAAAEEKGSATDFRGMSLSASVKKIEGMNLEGESLQKFLGSSEAVNAYRAIASNRATYEQAVGDVEKANVEDMITPKLQMARGNLSLAAARKARVSEAGLELAREGKGIARNLSDMAINADQAAMERAGTNEWVSWGKRKAHETTRWLFGDEDFLRMQTGDLRQVGLGQSREVNAPTRSGGSGDGSLIAEQKELIKEQKAANKELASAAQRINHPKANPAMSHPDRDL